MTSTLVVFELNHETTGAQVVMVWWGEGWLYVG